MKLKNMPSLKQKKRYIKFRLIASSREIQYFELKDAIWNAVLFWLGEMGAGESRLRIIKNLWNPESMEGVISCSIKSVDSIKVALSLVQNIGDRKTIFNIVKVSGTIKGTCSITRGKLLRFFNFPE